ncbi:hypothetical protein [Cellulomonas rhizosphaerae]|nr:hypothetical protein [Cellulomonas rhizosphaerae]
MVNEDREPPRRTPLRCAILGHKVTWVASEWDETPVCRRCGAIVPDEET